MKAARTCCKATHIEGLWGAPTAERCWRKVIVAQIIIAREEEVAQAFGINHPGG